MDFACSCRSQNQRRVSEDALAAYCATCLGWLKRPTRTGTSFEAARNEALEASGRLEGHPDLQNASPLHKGGRPKLKDSCSKGHASWAWTRDKHGRGRCRLCEQSRSAAYRKRKGS
jgi:hypothetical protein